MRGSLTVEASYVLPLSFFVLLLIWQLGIYQYDCAAAKMTAYECILIMAEKGIQEEQNFAEELERMTKAEILNRSFGMQDPEVTVKITASKIKISCFGKQGMLRIPFEIEAVYERCYPEMTLLIKRKIGGTYE